MCSRALYAKPEDIDLFVGALVETISQGNSGPTAGCIIGINRMCGILYFFFFVCM